MKFKKDDEVTWDTWGAGKAGERDAIHHGGHVFEVIPAGMLPHEVNRACNGVASTCTPRKEESYIVYEYTRLYWPRVSALFPATPSSKPQQGDKE